MPHNFEIFQIGFFFIKIHDVRPIFLENSLGESWFAQTIQTLTFDRL
jgi:hypothetical protein